MSGSQLQGSLAVMAGVGIVFWRHGIARVYLRTRMKTARRLPQVSSAIRGQPGSKWEAFLTRWPLIVAWIVGIAWWRGGDRRVIVAVVGIGALAIGVLEFLPGSKWRWLAVVAAIIVTAGTMGLCSTEHQRSRIDGLALGLALFIDVALCIGTLGIALTG